MSIPLSPSHDTARSDPAFAEGVALFNAGAYWEAHEAWERCWREAEEPAATLFKGIIQAAAALVHWQRGNPRGLRRNWWKARPRLVAVAPLIHTLDLQAFVDSMDSFVTAQGFVRPTPRLHYSGASIVH